MTISSGNFAELLWPGIMDLWGQSYNDEKMLYPRVFSVRKSDKAFEKFQGVTGLGLAGEKNIGDAIPYEDPYQGLQKEFVNCTYALGTSVTREMWEDDQYNYINTCPKMLARSMRHTEETLAFQHFNRAFNSSFTGADGIQLCSGGGSGGTAHPLVGGGTFRNELATSADLTQTSLEQLLQDMMDMVDDQSLDIKVLPKCLVVPTQVNFRARKLMESGFVTQSADNDVNPIPGLFEDLVVSTYLTDTDAWFVITDVPNGLIWLNRREAEIVRDNEFDTQNLKFATTARFSSGWVDPRGVFGSAGA